MSQWIVPARVRIQPHASPNHGERPRGSQSINAITLHADGSRTASATLSWVGQRTTKPVSYHYLIGRLGDVYGIVDDTRRAWHAGASIFRGVLDVNDFAIGVSFSNNQVGEPFDDRAIAAGIRLCADLMRRYPAITIDRIHTHQQVASCDKGHRGALTCEHYPQGRKHDPGPLFPLHEFVAEVARVAALAV